LCYSPRDVHRIAEKLNNALMLSLLSVLYDLRNITKFLLFMLWECKANVNIIKSIPCMKFIKTFLLERLKIDMMTLIVLV